MPRVELLCLRGSVELLKDCPAHCGLGIPLYFFRGVLGIPGHGKGGEISPPVCLRADPARLLLRKRTSKTL